MTDNPQAGRYRTPEVEAVQWTGDNADQMRAFCSPFDFQEIEPEDRVEDPDQTAAMRESAHGTWRGLTPGDWAVRRGNDFFEVSAADFARQYEPAVPSAPADRAAILREAADICDEAGAVYASKALNDHADGAFALMERFLRKADEAEYVATPCSLPNVCEDGGEPCSTHERLMAHAEGDHELCEPDCGTSPSRMADEVQQPETGVLAAALDGLHTLIATSSRDWQTYRVDAWLWAVLCGWDCEQDEHDETCTHGALEETAAMHGWDDDTVTKARRYRAAVRAITGE